MTLTRLTTTIVTATLCTLILSGCLRPYRMDIQQGNVVTQEMLDQLKPGMTRREVTFILGSPMIEDPFHADRWDYVYSMREGRSRERDQSVVTVFFDGDRMTRVAGDPGTSSVESNRVRLDSPLEADPEKAKKKRKNPFKSLWNKVKGVGKKKPES